MIRLYNRAFFVVLLFLFVTCSVVFCADFWVSGTDAAVVTSNDCGQISAVHGEPVVVRSFQEAGSPGIKAMLTDKIYSGDEIRVPDGGRLEVVSGSNLVVVFGGGSRVRFSGLRGFAVEGGGEASRLDLELIGGEMRVQARRNKTRPESVLIVTEGADVLVRGGDVCLRGGESWRGSVLSGEALVRMRRGVTIGAAFALAEGRGVGGSGQSDLAASVREDLVKRLPFSFELMRAALPPLPSLTYELEAP